MYYSHAAIAVINYKMFSSPQKNFKLWFSYETSNPLYVSICLPVLDIRLLCSNMCRGLWLAYFSLHLSCRMYQCIIPFYGQVEIVLLCHVLGSFGKYQNTWFPGVVVCCCVITTLFQSGSTVHPASQQWRHPCCFCLLSICCCVVASGQANAYAGILF